MPTDRGDDVKTCSVDGCARGHYAKGYCTLHYRRVHNHGSVELPDREDPKLRFDKTYEIDPETGCWNWQGSIAANGYGRFCLDRKSRPAHRFSYEAHVGPVPEGLEMDHLCHNRACVNPDHLEAVSRNVNMHRRRASWSSTGIMGVSRHPDGKRYRAKVQRDGVLLLRKYFRTVEEAADAAARVREEYDASRDRGRT